MNPSITLDTPFASEQDSPELSRHRLGFRIITSMFLCIVLQVVSAALGLVFFYQVVFSFVSQRRPDVRVTEFGQVLSRYVFEIFRYLTFNRDSAPFPFSDWRELDQEEPPREPLS